MSALPYPPAENQDDLDAVAIVDNGEPLVDFTGLSPRLVAAKNRPVFEFPFVHLVRKSVADMLVAAAESLPSGLMLCVVEGYRPINIQRAMYNHVVDTIRAEHPSLADSELMAEVGRRSAPPDAVTPPPHLTGGAVDVDILDEHGRYLDLVSPFKHGDWRQFRLDSPGLSVVAKKNRAILKAALEPTGLTNYLDEWWHWSYGDNGWALRTEAPHAIYGRVDLPDGAHWIGDMKCMPNEFGHIVAKTGR